MRNFVSLRYVHDNAPSIWKYMTEHNCILKKFGSTIYEGILDEGKYLKYLSDDDSPSITVECYVNPDSTILLTVENNDYIEKVKSLSSKVEDIIENPKLYCEAINMITLIPMVEGNTLKDKIKYVLEEGEEEGQGMDDAASEETSDTGDDGNTENNSPALGQDGAYKSGSIGIPLPTNHIKIIDPATLKTMPYGEVGEICINNKGLMMGYLNNESETNAVLQMHPDGHIWLHTGDLGYMDDEGFIFVKGRSKRMIITSGYNVYPSHVEEVIESHPAVLQCTVVGVPHPYKQEAVKAFIVLRDGYNWLFVKKDIQDYCKKNLAKYMVPSEYVRRKALPKTKIGKVDFKALQSDIGADDED